jgi:hypothetical protein
MPQSIQHDRYPKFVADQVLTEKSLNQMFGYLEEQERLTRTTLIGIGVMCGMNVKVAPDGSALTITHGVGVTSKGFLVPFPETTYTLYDDKFSAEQEILYPPFLNGADKQKFPLYLLHNNGSAQIKKPITNNFLQDKAVVIFVELLKVDNKNCDPDSCDDKGTTIEVTHRPLLVDLKNLDDLIYNSDDKTPNFEPVCVEWPEIKMPRYNVPSTYILNSETVLKNFLDVLNEDFIKQIEAVLKASYNALGYYIEEDYPNNPFNGFKNKFSFLYDGSLDALQLLHIQYYYDFFSDLLLAYDELRQMCNECLTICCPDEKMFPRHLILGNAIPAENEFRHHWIQSPAFSCNCCSEGKTKFLLRKIVLLLEKLDLPKPVISKTKEPIRITPSQYGNLPLSNKAIPYYYNVVNAPNELFKNWNFQKSKLKKGDTNYSYFAPDYSNESHIKDPLSYDIEPHNFFRIEGHIGKNWRSALGDILKIKNEKRLPIDVVALNGDILELIRSIYSNANSLSEVVSGNPGVSKELMCYFSDLEGQYDVQAAELRCTILKVMVYFYNLKLLDRDVIESSSNFPQSDLIRKAFPNYTTFKNTYGERFDAFYASVKNQPYITPGAFLSNFNNNSTNGFNNLLEPIYLMYYLEKIHEALADGLVDLKINDLTQRLYDAVYVASSMQVAFDSNSDFNLPTLYEDSLNAVIRICKAEVFRVIYRNYLINYILFISNQSFAMYAFNNSGIQHKAGVTTGGTFVLVYRDKRPEDLPNIAGTSDFAAPNPNANVEEKNTNATMAGEVFTAFAANPATEKSKSSNAEFIGVSQAKSYSKKEFDVSSKLKEANTIKGMGMRNIFDFTDSFTANDKLTNDELKNLVDQFPDGTVIADFFVPNMCKSACMAMNFIVLGGKEEEDEEPSVEVRLEIEEKNYCENDSKKYPINVDPEGGKLLINGQASTEFFFAPSLIDVGNAESIDITISYTFSGITKTRVVTVFKKPKASFKITRIDAASKTIAVENTSQFGKSFLWDFGDGKTSDLKDPNTHTYSTNIQSAEVNLTVFNGPCEDKAKPDQVNFEEVNDEVLACTSIGQIGDLFKQLNEASTDEFTSLIDGFGMWKSIFVDKIDNLLALSQQEQFEILINDLSLNRLEELLKVLNSIILSNPKQRRFALLMHNIVVRLLMFYACVQKEDINKAEFSTKNLFDLVNRNIRNWIERKIKFNNAELKLIDSLLSAINSEMDLTRNNTPNKKEYLLVLDTAKKLLKTILG